MTTAIEANHRMRIATPAHEATLPSIARPSQILRSHTRRRWCKEKIRRETRTGAVQLCAVGRLADAAGFSWSAWDGASHERSNAAIFVRDTYGLKFNQITAIMLRNDRHGLDEVIAFLEQRGL